MKSTLVPVFIFEMKENVREAESNWRFQKNIKYVYKIRKRI